MQYQRSHSITRIYWRLAATICSLIIMASAALAQQTPIGVGPPPGAGAPLGATPKERAQDMQNREWRLRNVERDAAQAQVNQQRVQAAIEIVKQDFKRIQIIRNKMVDNLVANNPLDYKLISEQTEEINKRAHQLKTFLMPPVPDEKEKEQKTEVEYKPAEMKGALVKLCNTIFNFTENPVLKTPDVVDVQQSAKAGRDLLSIIELSGDIKRSAEKLGKE
jgi:hypothetical protein